MKPELTIVILSYNTKDLLFACLGSLEHVRQEANFGVVVVDNASSDGSADAVEGKKWKIPVSVIRNTANLGFAKGNNVALKKITTDFTLILNPDTVVQKGAINKPLNYLKKHSDVAAVTCFVQLPGGEIDYSCHRGFPTPWNSLCYLTGISKLFPKVALFNGYTLAYKPLTTTHEIDSLNGAYALMRTAVGHKIGWFDEDYFWNGEDIDMCYRIKKMGWKIVFYPEARIIHYKGSASGLKNTGKGNAPAETKKMAALSSTQVMKLFYEKNLKSQYPFFVNWFVSVGIWLLTRKRMSKI